MNRLGVCVIIINFGTAAGFTAIAIHNTREINKGTP